MIPLIIGGYFIGTSIIGAIVGGFLILQKPKMILSERMIQYNSKLTNFSIGVGGGIIMAIFSPIIVPLVLMCKDRL